jgi:hypothetical protein
MEQTPGTRGCAGPVYTRFTPGLHQVYTKFTPKFTQARMTQTAGGAASRRAGWALGRAADRGHVDAAVAHPLRVPGVGRRVHGHARPHLLHTRPAPTPFTWPAPCPMHHPRPPPPATTPLPPASAPAPAPAPPPTLPPAPRRIAARISSPVPPAPRRIGEEMHFLARALLARLAACTRRCMLATMRLCLATLPSHGSKQGSMLCGPLLRP